MGIPHVQILWWSEYHSFGHNHVIGWNIKKLEQYSNYHVNTQHFLILVFRSNFFNGFTTESKNNSAWHNLARVSVTKHYMNSCYLAGLKIGGWWIDPKVHGEVHFDLWMCMLPPCVFFRIRTKTWLSSLYPKPTGRIILILKSWIISLFQILQVKQSSQSVSSTHSVNKTGCNWRNWWHLYLSVGAA